MAHEDLGFVADSDHSDLGFEPDSDNKGAAMAALEHFGNAASLGYAPHLQAAAEKPMDWLLDKITGNHVSDDLPDYVTRRDQNIARMKREEKDFPKASLAGTIGGGLTSGIAASAAAPIDAATWAGRALQAGKVGATLGAVSNPGDTEGEVSPLQLKDRATDAAITGLTSTALNPAIEGIGNALGYVGGKVKDFAEQKAFKALGPYQRNVLQNSDEINQIGRTVLDKGVIGKVPTSYEGLADRAGAAKDQVGEQIENIVNDLADQEDVPALSRKTIADNMRNYLKAQPGIPGSASKNARLAKLIQEFEDTGKIPTSVPLSADDSALENVKLKYGKPETQSLAIQPTDGDFVSPTDILDELNPKEKFQSLKDYGDVFNDVRGKLIDQTTADNLAEANKGFNPYGKLPEVQVSPVEKTGYLSNDEIPLKDARDIKQAVKGEIRWDRLPGTDIPLPEQVNRSLYTQLAKGENSIADQLAAEGKIPNADAFKNAKATYGDLDEAEKISQKRSDKDFANQFLGLKDTIMGSTGAGIGYYAGEKVGGHEGGKAGAIIGGLAGGMGNKLVRTYGNQIAASYGDSIAKLLAQSPALANAVAKNPGVAGNYLQSLLRQDKPAQDQAAPSDGLSPQLMDQFQKNPKLIEGIQDPALKEQVQKRLKNQTDRAPSQEGFIPDDQAKSSFIQGN